MNSILAYQQQTPGLACELASRIVAMRAEPLPQQALRWVRMGILDTLGVTLAGHAEPAPTLAARSLAPGDGPCLWLGKRQRIGALDAALINGTASHALDFDDCNNTMGGHPSAPVLSALVPLAEQLGSSGSRFVAAYVAGFETETKIARAVNFHHYMKGWHPTATLGTFGAAAACAQLMDLDVDATATALALAASFASGIKANFGTMTKPLHVGHCARNGLFAARLASQGFTANLGSVFEHKQGFLEVFNGSGNYDAARALDTWAAPLDIVEPGIAIKQFPCCGSTHPAIDAMLELVHRHCPALDDVQRVDVEIHGRRLTHTNRPAPQSALDAKFSLQYVVARALADGRVGVSDFSEDAWTDARIQALLPSIHVSAYNERPDSVFSEGNHFGGRVRVTLRDGTVLAAEVDQPQGRTSANPLSDDQLHAKFTLCVRGVLHEQAIPIVLDALSRVETLPRMTDLTQLIDEATL